MDQVRRRLRNAIIVFVAFVALNAAGAFAINPDYTFESFYRAMLLMGTHHPLIAAIVWILIVVSAVAYIFSDLLKADPEAMQKMLDERRREMEQRARDLQG